MTPAGTRPATRGTLTAHLTPAPMTHPLINIVPLGQGRRRRVTYQQVLKSCGKARCKRCMGGTVPAHGPYWQRIEWDPATGKTRCSYVGLRLPDDVVSASSDQLARLAATVDRLKARIADLTLQLRAARAGTSGAAKAR